MLNGLLLPSNLHASFKRNTEVGQDKNTVASLNMPDEEQRQFCK